MQSALGNTSVSGPGQKAVASARARWSGCTTAKAAAVSAKCAIRGLKRGRPLVSKIRATASGERRARNEDNDYREIAIWKDGVTL